MPKVYDFVTKSIKKNLGTDILSTIPSKEPKRKKDDRFPDGDIAPKGWHQTKIRSVG